MPASVSGAFESSVDLVRRSSRAMNTIVRNCKCTTPSLLVPNIPQDNDSHYSMSHQNPSPNSPYDKSTPPSHVPSKNTPRPPKHTDLPSRPNPDPYKRFRHSPSMPHLPQYNCNSMIIVSHLVQSINRRRGHSLPNHPIVLDHCHKNTPRVVSRKVDNIH